MKYYAGIGSRETPKEVLDMMSKISLYLEKNGYILRSGGADGADSAFEKEISKKQIFLPWKNFNNNPSPLFRISEEAKDIAKKFHPYFDNMKQGAQKLHSRNVYQVLGENLNEPVDFVICWTKNGGESGGTGQALRIAREYKIKIYNLAREDDFNFWKNIINQ